MKAWIVREKDEFCAIVVFAETRGKAKSTALHTYDCEDAEFCDLEVNRAKYADKYYTIGKDYLDWEIPKDRIALVKDCGFTCNYECRDDCEICSAKQYCDYYKESKQNE